MPITTIIEHFITKLGHKDYGEPHEVERRFWFRKGPRVEFADMSLPTLRHDWLQGSNQIATLIARHQAEYAEIVKKQAAEMAAATARAPLQPQPGSITSPPPLDITPEDRPSIH
jgi:hypothetical protein